MVHKNIRIKVRRHWKIASFAENSQGAYPFGNPFNPHAFFYSNRPYRRLSARVPVHHIQKLSLKASVGGKYVYFDVN